MKQPHWVWATDATTKDRIPVNLSAIPTMLPGKLDDGRAITILFLGGVAMDQHGQMHYARAHVMESPAELFIAPPIPLAEMPKALAKLARPHAKDK